MKICKSHKNVANFQSYEILKVKNLEGVHNI